MQNYQSDRSKKGPVPIIDIQTIRKNSFISKQRDTIGLFMKVIGELQIRARNLAVLMNFMQMFILDTSFGNLCLNYTKMIFEDVNYLVGKSQANLEHSGLLEDDATDFKDDFDRDKVAAFDFAEQKLFQLAKYVRSKQ